jgi:hypothetical protein
LLGGECKITVQQLLLSSGSANKHVSTATEEWFLRGLGRVVISRTRESTDISKYAHVWERIKILVMCLEETEARSDCW